MSIKGKLFKDLTEEEVIYVALEVVQDYRAKIRGTGEFNVDRCVQMAIDHLKWLYKSKHGIFTHTQMSQREREEMAQIVSHYHPILYARISDIQQKYLQSRKVSEINAATAKALITSRFDAAGFTAIVTGQFYRARVEVKISPTYRVRFYLNYKKMFQDGVLDNAITAVKDLANAIDRLGYGTMVERV